MNNFKLSFYKIWVHLFFLLEQAMNLWIKTNVHSIVQLRWVYRTLHSNTVFTRVGCRGWVGWVGWTLSRTLSRLDISVPGWVGWTLSRTLSRLDTSPQGRVWLAAPIFVATYRPQKWSGRVIGRGKMRRGICSCSTYRTLLNAFLAKLTTKKCRGDYLYRKNKPHRVAIVNIILRYRYIINGRKIFY